MSRRSRKRSQGLEQREGNPIASSEPSAVTPTASAQPAASAPVQQPLSKKQRKAMLRTAQRTEITTEFYAGLLPHPEHLERFEKLQPGTTSRLMAMAEKQGEHRQAMERQFLNFNGFSQVAGTIFAGIVALGSVGASVYLLATGHSLIEFAAMLTPLAAIVWAFRKTQKRQATEIARKK